MAGPITLSVTSLTLIGVGSANAQAFTVTDPLFTGSVTVVSSNTGAATVSPAAKLGPGPFTVVVTPIAPGTTTITVSDGVNTKTLVVTVAANLRLTLQDMENRVLLYAREPGANPGGPPNIPSTAELNKTQIDQDLNFGIQNLIAVAGLPSNLLERLVSLPVIAGQDVSLPQDIGALLRVEYWQNGSIPYPLVAKNVWEFDTITGAGYGASVNATGSPYCYRAPIAGSIRLYPAPILGNQTAGDILNVYYVSMGATLLAATDVSPLPLSFQEAPICFTLERYFAKKKDDANVAYWGGKWSEYVKLAKAYAYNVNKEDTFAMQDDQDIADVSQQVWGSFGV